MAFWGVYLKPNEPYTLHYDDDDTVPKRLRITQATLGDATRNSPARSIVRCSIGDKPTIVICSLSVKEMTCCQLDLEFEEPQTVILSVMGPRGVYLAGYLIVPPPHPPTSHHHALCHEGKEKALMENAGCRDAHELDSNKTDSTTVEIRDINHCDKNLKGGKRFLKCYSNKEIGKDDNQDSSFGSHKKYITRQQVPRSSDEDGENSSALKSFSVFARLLEEKRDAIEKKKKKRNMKRKMRIPDNTKEREKKHKRRSSMSRTILAGR
ncbi:peptidyl-prolyl cis-trans isomerase FKBP43 [Lactuca sativa]|uniref:peptidyl-prolyl cis-trans isomerase FKBP43 n=1 Tax=Lactuca sativa TaxID=4236 RepID=UPI0022AF8467|nr:peptidyl-prolyl cis-trans isomerase FKBP43 [Lactuca sativa]